VYLVIDRPEAPWTPHGSTASDEGHDAVMQRRREGADECDADEGCEQERDGTHAGGGEPELVTECAAAMGYLTC
jgi:hypothetical protein